MWHTRTQKKKYHRHGSRLEGFTYRLINFYFFKKRESCKIKLVWAKFEVTGFISMIAKMNTSLISPAGTYWTCQESQLEQSFSLCCRSLPLQLPISWSFKRLVDEQESIFSPKPFLVQYIYTYNREEEWSLLFSDKVGICKTKQTRLNTNYESLGILNSHRILIDITENVSSRESSKYFCARSNWDYDDLHKRYCHLKLNKSVPINKRSSSPALFICALKNDSETRNVLL